MKLKQLALLAGLLVLTGCVAPQVPMSKQVQSNLNQVEGILVIPQSNLNITVQATNPGNTGAIGSLIASAIDAMRRSSAVKEAAPITQPLQDYDFRAVMLNATNEAIGKIDQIKVNLPLRLDIVGSESSNRINFDNSTASAVLFCNVRYHMEEKNLFVTADAEIYPKLEVLKQFRNKPMETNPLDSGNVIYRKTFTFTKQAITPAIIKDALTEAANSIAAQLAADLNHGI